MQIRVVAMVAAGLVLVGGVAEARNGIGVLGAFQAAGDGDPGAGGGLRYEYDFSEEHSVRLLAQALQLTGFGEESDSAGIFGLSFGSEASIDVTAVELGIVYDMPASSVVQFYVGGGVGLYMVDMEYESGVTLGSTTINADSTVEADDVVSGFAVLGIEVNLGRHVRLAAEARYTALEVEGDASAGSGSGGGVSVTTSSRTLEYDLSGAGAIVGVIVGW